MKKIILIFLSILAVGALAYFAYPVISERYFTQPPAATTSNAPIVFHDLNEAAKQAELAAPAAEETPVAPGEENAAPPKDGKKNVQTNITRENCADDCKVFAKDGALFTYCQQVCGLAPTKSDSDCDSKAALEKDYCQKDLAVSKTDAALCETITDDNIRQTCHNRIAEDIVEKMQSGTQE